MSLQQPTLSNIATTSINCCSDNNLIAKSPLLIRQPSSQIGFCATIFPENNGCVRILFERLNNSQMNVSLRILLHNDLSNKHLDLLGA